MISEVPLLRGQIVFTLTEVPVVWMMEKEASRLRPPVRILVKSFVLGVVSRGCSDTCMAIGGGEGEALSCGLVNIRFGESGLPFKTEPSRYRLR